MSIINYIDNYIKSNLEIIIFMLCACILVYIISKHNWDKINKLQDGINRLDAIIYINPDNNNNNKELLMKELKKLNTDMNKVHRVKSIYVPVVKSNYKGCMQSHILALKMIKKNNWDRVLILEDNIELSLHPDIINELINKSLEKLDSKHPDWSVIMLATSNKIIDNRKSPKTTKASTNTNANTNTNTNNIIPMDIYSTDGTIIPLNIEKLQSANTSSAYIVNKSYAEHILNLYNNNNTNNMDSNINMNTNNYTYKNDISLDKIIDSSFKNWSLDKKWSDLQNKDKWFCIDKDPIQERHYI